MSTGDWDGQHFCSVLWFPPRRWQAAVLNNRNTQIRCLIPHSVFTSAFFLKTFFSFLFFFFSIRIWIETGGGFFFLPRDLKSHVLLIYLCVFPLTASAPLFVHEAWINTASLTISENHADERSAWTQEKLDTKEPKGTLLFFQLFRSFCPGLSISPEANEKKQNSIVYIIQKITGGCLTPEQKALDPPKKGKKMGY